jgi:hypothetical protein
MKTRKLAQFLAAIMVVLLFACDKHEMDTPQREQSEKVGFTGTLPDNLTFGDENISSSNHVSGIADSTGGAAYLTHFLNIRDSVAGSNIQVRLPFIKYNDKFNPETDDLIKDAQVHYPYQQVKNLLSPGNKPILSLQEPDQKKGFMIWVGGNSFNGYSNDQYFDQVDSQLKVTQLTEGTETDPTRGQVKTLHATFAVDVNLYPRNANYNQAKKFKGILQVKYREIK